MATKKIPKAKQKQPLIQISIETSLIFENNLCNIKAKIKLYGITAKELGFGTSSVSIETTSTRSPVAIKYRHGDNTWTGRGRQPLWVVDYLSNGGKIDELKV